MNTVTCIIVLKYFKNKNLSYYESYIYHLLHFTFIIPKFNEFNEI